MQFSVLLSVAGIPDRYNYQETCYRDVLRACQAAGLAVDETEPGDSEYDYLATETDDNPDPDSFWGEWKAGVQDLTASGIIGKEAFTELMESIGAYPEDCETLGTLGGPLAPWGGVVPDISFRMECQELIDSIRVTPVPKRFEREPASPEEAEDTWDRLRAAIFKYFENR